MHECKSQIVGSSRYCRIVEYMRVAPELGNEPPCRARPAPNPADFSASRGVRWTFGKCIRQKKILNSCPFELAALVDVCVPSDCASLQQAPPVCTCGAASNRFCDFAANDENGYPAWRCNFCGALNQTRGGRGGWGGALASEEPRRAADTILYRDITGMEPTAFEERRRRFSYEHNRQSASPSGIPRP